MVHCVEELAFTTHSSNQAQRPQSLHVGHHIAPARIVPTILAIISGVNHTFIDVDDGLACTEELDVLCCCSLSLKLRRKEIVSDSDRLDFLIGET